MTAVDEIKNKIQRLFHTDPIIHIDVSMNRPKIRIANQEARIKGVYSNVFQIEAQQITQLHKTISRNSLFAGWTIALLARQTNLLNEPIILLLKGCDLSLSGLQQFIFRSGNGDGFRAHSAAFSLAFAAAIIPKTDRKVTKKTLKKQVFSTGFSPGWRL